MRAQFTLRGRVARFTLTTTTVRRRVFRREIEVVVNVWEVDGNIRGTDGRLLTSAAACRRFIRETT
jgi:hypothetical protein